MKFICKYNMINKKIFIWEKISITYIDLKNRVQIKLFVKIVKFKNFMRLFIRICESIQATKNQ